MTIAAAYITWQAFLQLSPTQSQTKVADNILHYLRHGGQLGWLLDFQARSVLVYQPDRLPDLLLGVGKLPTLGGVTLKLSVKTVSQWVVTMNGERGVLVQRPKIIFSLMTPSNLAGCDGRPRF